MRWLPGVQTLRRYELAWLRRDVLAGVVLAAFLVPVGIAYAVASGVPAIYGLYATIAGLLAYAVFGPSRILVYGPDSALAAIILGTVLPLSGGDPTRAVALAGAMALVSGMVCVVAGLARLGFLTELLSKPIRYGYMNGIALAVMISQLPKLFEISIERRGPLGATAPSVEELVGGRGERGRARARRGDARGAAAVQALQADPGGADRGGRGDGDLGWLGLAARGRQGARRDPAGPAAFMSR